MIHTIRLFEAISEFKYSIKLALPLIIAEVIYALNSFIATIMVAQLGKEQLATNALVWNIHISITLFFIGTLCAISIMISQSLGANDTEGISICFKQGVILSIIFSLPMMLIIWFAPAVLIWTKQNPKVIRYAEPFFHSLTWAMLPLNLTFAIQQFLIGLTKTRVVMLMGIIIVPIEIFFYYVFLFGKLGIPKIGLAGIGYGMAISHWIIILVFIGYLSFSKTLKAYNLFKKWWSIEYRFLIELLRIGLPQGLMLCSEISFFAIIAIMMGILGVSTLAAYQITEQFLLIALVIVFALSQNVTIRIGYEVGRNDRSKLKLITIVNIAIGLCLVSILSLFYTLFPETVIGIDIDTRSGYYKDVAIEAAKFFPIIATLLLVECIRLICNGALRGLKDTNFQLMISILGFWIIAFPITYILGFKFNFGGHGIWWGIVIGVFIISIIQIIRFNRLHQTINLSLSVTKK